MLNPWLFLGSIAFVTSFAVSLLMTSDLGGSLVAGSSALVTAFATAAAVNWYRNQATDRRLAALKHQIRVLQRRRAEEEQAVIDLSAEKERVMVSLNSLQENLRQRQLPSANPYAPPALSWNLSSPPPEMVQAAIAETEAEIQPEFHPASLTQFINEAAATKQKITASLNQLQSELSQLNGQVSEQQQVRDQLIQDVQQLTQQKQHLDTTTRTMTQDVAELERCRRELDEYVVYLETKKQELESGANPLQKALKQLQSQVTALQEELRSLESQVTAKRREKDALEQEVKQSSAGHSTKSAHNAMRQLEIQKAQLEQELMTLRQDQKQAIALQQLLPQLEHQKSQLETELASLRQRQATTQSVQTDLKQLETQKSRLERDLATLKHQEVQLQSAQDTLQKVEKQIRDRRQEKESLEKQITQLQAQKTALRNQPTPAPAANQLDMLEPTGPNGKNGHSKSALERPVSRPKSQPLEPDAWVDDSAEQELSDLWTDFMVQLPEYELQALKAIAHDNNPTRVLNRIAEDNFTTPEELIASINQLAEDIVGERVIKARGSAPPIVMKTHQRTIKKLIETYEYLTE